MKIKTGIFRAVLATPLVALALWLSASLASAHPLTQGAMDVLVSPTKVLLRAKVSIEEVIVSNSVRKDEKSATLKDACRNHGLYLLNHIFVSADGQSLRGALISANEAEKNGDIVLFKFAFDLPPNLQPQEITLSQNVMNEVEYAPGNRWEASYLTRIGHKENELNQATLFTSQSPITYKCNWNGSATVESGNLFSQYLIHGVGHIIGHRTEHGWGNIGFDHLLFVTALAIAAHSFWDLLKLVSAFTLAHTLTLTLSVLNVVRLPERVVEPMIALSIVFVAVENLWRPERTQRWVRLASAFFFGLFHGLGFAGGLLNASEAIQGVSVVTAIIAFSLGVEIGHQIVVLPVFGFLKLARNRHHDELARGKFSASTLKYGSAVISVAGVFYLITALGWLSL